MLEKLKEILERIAPEIDASTVTEKTKLADDLGFDSMSMMLLSLEIEEAFGFRFEETVRFETIGDVIKYVEAMKK